MNLPLEIPKPDPRRDRVAPSGNIPPDMEDAHTASLPSSLEGIYASAKLRAEIAAETPAQALSVPLDGFSRTARIRAAEILRARCEDHHFLARTGDSLLSHFIYELRNFRLTDGFFLDGAMSEKTRIEYFTLYDSEIQGELASKLENYCDPKTGKFKYYCKVRSCFSGPRKVGIAQSDGSCIQTPILDPENPRREDLIGIEKKLLSGTLQFVAGAATVGACLGAVAGTVWLGLIHEFSMGSVGVWTATGAKWAAALAGISGIALYSAQILRELGSAFSMACRKRFSHGFPNSGEELANRILLPLYLSSAEPREKTAILEAIIRQLCEEL